MERAKNLITTGFNTLLHHVTKGKEEDALSDEEQIPQNETEAYIEKGVRGILVFQTTSLKTGKKKFLHLNLQKSVLVSYHESSRRVTNCSDIVSVTKFAEKQINLELRGNRSKGIIFDKEGIADRFHKYLEFIIEQGKAIKRAFNEIDYTRTNQIQRPDLERALVKADLEVDDDSISKM
jgi:hypothetical protein